MEASTAPAPDPTKRFSARVENYVKYRPGYSAEVIDLLRREIGLTTEWHVADIGSGTGISSSLFLDAGCAVVGIEPNDEMRQAAERLLAGEERFTSIAGSAEATTLADALVDLVVAGQAFHWFDASASAREFQRILRPGGWVLLMWNTRKTSGSPFLQAYERLLLDYGTDYARVRHDGAPRERIAEFFGSAGFRTFGLPNRQTFDYDGLAGRLMSSSYVPAPGEGRHGEMMSALRDVFDRHQTRGRVAFDYDTELYVGRW